MFPLTVLLTTSLVDQAAPIYTIEDVAVHRRFAGALGSRLITELTLSSPHGKVIVTIKDIRHSRFQKTESAFTKGGRVRIPGGLKGGSINLRADQVKTV